MALLLHQVLRAPFLLFFFNDTATTEIYTLSLHDALPIWVRSSRAPSSRPKASSHAMGMTAVEKVLALKGGCAADLLDRKSTRLNSSHLGISYAVFCLKKKRKRHVLSTSFT